MASDKPPVASVDSVREELRRLGYFDSGIDRYVLGGARAGGSTWAACWSAAWRVGLAGGIVLGIALALLAAAVEPQALHEQADRVVLVLYLALAVGLATTLGTFALGMLAAALPRGLVGPRTGGAPRVIGLALAGATLAYLGLWWTSHASAAPALQQGVFGLMGVAIAFLLGRFGAVAAVAVLSAAGLADRMPEAALTRRRLLPLLFGAALVFGASLAMAGYLETRAETAPDFAVIPTGLRIRVVGIDGLERRMADLMTARGDMPHLAKLIAEGASAPLRPEPEQVPAIVWTTTATGRGPEAHGIRSAGSRRLPGMAAPIPTAGFGAALARAADIVRLTRTEPATAVLRGAKTFWNVAAEKGLRVGVVNWWATWPAEPLNGFVVSDRAFLKLEKGGPPDREVSPETAFEQLRGVLGPADVDRARRLDRFHVSALALLSKDSAPDLETIYLNGLDVFTMQRLETSPADVASLDAKLEEVRDYHRFLDALIGELSADLGPTQMLVLVGDPGRFARRSNQEALGLLVIAGGPARQARLPTATERDVTPTVLHLAGLPVSRELSGQALEAALDPAFRKAHPLRQVASYGKRPRGARAESSFDPQVLEELRSLGYIR